MVDFICKVFQVILFIKHIKILEYDRVDISEGIDNIVLIILLLYILREMFTEFIFGIWVKMMKLTLMNGSNLVDKKGVL